MSNVKLFYVSLGVGIAYSTVITKATAKALSAKAAAKTKRKEERKKQQDDRIFDEATC